MNIEDVVSNIKSGDLILFTHNFCFTVSGREDYAPKDQLCFVLSAINPYRYYVYFTIIVGNKLQQIKIYDTYARHIVKIV